MSVENTPFREITSTPAPLVLAPREGGREPRRFPFPGGRGPRRRKPRIRKLRVFLIFVAFLSLALVSTVFGMLMSVAADLPELKVTAVTNKNVDSYLYDDTGQPIGVLAPPGRAVIDTWDQIGSGKQDMVHAIVAVEDRRFWTDPGFDLKGLARAALSDVTGGQREGGSTIAEQYVKVRMSQEDHRTIFEKLREAALAFQLVHHWKRRDILTDYLNSIYFGNGAVGVEDAARVYFGQQLGYNPTDPGAGRCGDATVQHPKLPKCVQLLQPYQAALLAGMVANPTAFDPLLHPDAARARRNTVLSDMFEQHYITQGQYDVAVNRPLPQAASIQQPTEPAKAPYFAAWVRPQIIRALEDEGMSENRAVYEAYYGGLKIKLTLNLQLQQAAQDAINAEFPAGVNGPTASLVAIDNNTGEVRAMVSGDGDYAQDPFNLAVDGERQPGSSFKLFTLAAALTSGDFGPYSVINSHGPLDIPFTVPHEPTQHFIVHNFGNVYSGDISLETATAESDNSVFAQVGMTVGTKNIARFAHRMGIRSSVSTNPSMILGGLKTGVSALDMAHAYETVATGGLKVYNHILGDIHGGPIGIHAISGCYPCEQHGVAQPDIVNTPTRQRILSPDVAATIRQMLEGVVASGGTGTEAAIPGVLVAGKTGTTSNYVDAWFVGWTPQMTVAVWVGYPNSAVPMLTQWDGGPVEGGTYPAVIWRNFMESAMQIMADQASGHQTTTTTPLSTGAGTGPVATTPLSSTSTTATTPTSATTPSTTPTTATTPTGGQTAGTGAAAGATTNGTAGTATPAGTGAGSATTGATAGGTGAATGAAGSGTGSAGSAGAATGSPSSASAGSPAPSTGSTSGSGSGGAPSSSASGGAGLGGSP